MSASYKLSSYSEAAKRFSVPLLQWYKFQSTAAEEEYFVAEKSLKGTEWV